MSTRNTCQSVVLLSDRYVGLVDRSATFFDEPCMVNLAGSLEDDVLLRNFFIANTFSDIFSKRQKVDVQRIAARESNLYDFVRSTRIFPAMWLRYHDDSIINFFIDMRNHAQRVFNEKLERDFLEVCNKSEQLGLFEPLKAIHQIDSSISWAPVKDQEGTKDPLGIFYKVSEALFELWVKPEDKGKMLEAWTYNILKKHLHAEKIEILPNVKVFKKHDEPYRVPASLKELTEGSYLAEGRDEIGEIDCLIRHENGTKVLIECKMDKKTGWSDLLQFYGMMTLLKADFGLFLIGHKETFKSDQDFESIRLMPGVVDREDFPEVFLAHLRSKLKD